MYNIPMYNIYYKKRYIYICICVCIYTYKREQSLEIDFKCASTSLYFRSNDNEHFY